MKKKARTILIFILLTINILLIYRYVSILNREIMPADSFTDYYETTDDNDGFVLLEESFYTFIRQYSFVEKKEQEQISQEESPKPTKPTMLTYKVVSGDNLDKIAKKHNITVDTIKINNPGISNKLKVGQTLNIPNMNGFFYKIGKGDYLSKVAQKFGVKLSEITNYNDIDPKKIKLGMEIFVKDVSYEKWNQVMNPPKLKVKESSKDKSKTKKTTKTTEDTAPQVETKQESKQQIQASGRSGFAFPVRYKGISSPFGNRFHPVLKRYILHTGVDLVAKFVPLRAAKAGTVSFVGYMNGYGKIIIIKHGNGFETRYAHLSKISTKVGEYVNQGDLIGQTGNSGRVTGPHLHFEIRMNGVPKNPMNYLR